MAYFAHRLKWNPRKVCELTLGEMAEIIKNDPGWETAKRPGLTAEEAAKEAQRRRWASNGSREWPTKD